MVPKPPGSDGCCPVTRHSANSEKVTSGAVDPDGLAQVVDIIGRYPHTSPAENQEVVVFLHDGPVTDRNRLMRLSAIHDQLRQFQMDHQKQLSLPLRAYVISIGLVFAVLGLLVWVLWDAGL